MIGRIAPWPPSRPHLAAAARTALDDIDRMEHEAPSTNGRPADPARHVAAYAYIPNRGGRLAVIDTANGRALPSILLDNDATGVAVTPDGRRLYLTNADADTVTVLDTASRTVLATLPVEQSPRGIAIAPAGDRVYVVSAEADTLTLIDTATNTIIGSPVAAGPNPWALAITPDGRKAYIANATGNRVSVLNLSTYTIEAIIRTGALPSSVAIAPDGRHAYVANTGANTVTPIDLATDTPGPSIRVGALPESLAVAPDSRTIFVTNADAKTVSVIDARTHTVTTTVAMERRPVGIGMTPDRRFACVAHEDPRSVLLIDLVTHAIGTQIVPVGSEPFCFGLGPQVIVAGDPSVAPLTIADDAELTEMGFGRFLPFNGGALRLSGDWTTNRQISLLVEGGWIDTNGFDATIHGDVINDGSLTKTGAGTLGLYGRNLHRRDTFLLEGSLHVEDTHAAPIYIDGGTLRGAGSIGAIWATAGVIQPGGARPATLEAAQVTMAAGVWFVTELRGPVAGIDYGRLAVRGTAMLNDATLVVRPRGTLPLGLTCTIVTNARGTFANLPEGTEFDADGHRLRITYAGGAGNDVVLTVIHHA